MFLIMNLSNLSVKVDLRIYRDAHVFLVKMVDMNLFGTMRGFQLLDKSSKKLGGVLANMGVGILANYHHLSDVGFRLGMAYSTKLAITVPRAKHDKL